MIRERTINIDASPIKKAHCHLLYRMHCKQERLCYYVLDVIYLGSVPNTNLHCLLQRGV